MDLKIPIETPVTIKDTAAITKSAISTIRTGWTGADLIPSNWRLNAEGDSIDGVNIQTGNTFKGTMTEFNKQLRG